MAYINTNPKNSVYGRLVTDSVILRGDRLDRMFSYLPYDRVSGQWGKKGGIVIRKSSTGNVLRHTEIRNAGLYGVTCDSAAVVDGVLRLDMEDCIVHNTAGDCLYADNANIRLRNCLFSNAKGDCVCISGGKADISRCTMAQFYAFAGGRGVALSFTNMKTPLLELKCDSIVMTGYDDNEFIGLNTDTTKLFNYQFSRSLLRMPKIETKDSVRFESIIWEIRLALVCPSALLIPIPRHSRLILARITRDSTKITTNTVTITMITHISFIDIPRVSTVEAICLL